MKRVGDIICRDIECSKCPLNCIACYGTQDNEIFKTWEETIEEYPQLEPMRDYIEEELENEAEENDQRRN